ncbi:MAG: aminotransferase class I/II-fold pyridoxal phosphate-dependent enzyme [Phycisphaerales bacterium]|nr:aminotransferase class I/II-fold pyridoxal phosphate-dependent enzyme [Phycisphaerales bacterium]
MNELAHCISGKSAVKIAECVETAIQDGRVVTGERLPAVRELARRLTVSPATVAAAYQSLQTRGLVFADGRRGTRVCLRPTPRRIASTVPPPDVRNLADGNPDPALFPCMETALRSISPAPRLYGQRPHHAELVEIVARDLEREGVCRGEITFVNGAMDGVERVLAEMLRAGDRVGVEDPCLGNILDLVLSRGLSLIPIPVDSEGPLPDEMEHACRQGIRALILTPRAQNPTGAAISEDRARAMAPILRRHPDVLLIEDDHAAWISDVTLHSLHTAAARWVYVRSVSKALNPDLRLAAVTGDGDTMRRLLDRMAVGERWVSHVLQRIACAMLSDAGVRQSLKTAAHVYTSRRESLIAALRDVGVDSTGASGYNVWIPVAEETVTVQGLLQRGWAVAAGERYRINSPPAIRITAATLQPQESTRLAADLDAILQPARRTATV